jgi:hypothetical protein
MLYTHKETNKKYKQNPKKPTVHLRSKENERFLTRGLNDYPYIKIGEDGDCIVINSPGRELGIINFPFIIKDEHGRILYRENKNGTWFKTEYNEAGNIVYREDSMLGWELIEYDVKGNVIYGVSGGGGGLPRNSVFNNWGKFEYDSNNNCVYWVTNKGVMFDHRNKK